MKTIISNIITVAIAILILLYTINRYNGEYDEMLYIQTTLNDSIKLQNIKLLKKTVILEDTISYQKQIIITEKNASILYHKEIKELQKLNLKNLKARVTLSEKMTMLKIEVDRKEKDTIYYWNENYLCDDDGSSGREKAAYLRLPATFYKKSEFMDIEISLTEKGNEFNINEILSQPTFWLADQKGSLFKKKQAVVAYKNENPNISLVDMDNIIIHQPKKKWFQTKIAAFSAGVIFGAGSIIYGGIEWKKLQEKYLFINRYSQGKSNCKIDSRIQR